MLFFNRTYSVENAAPLSKAEARDHPLLSTKSDVFLLGASTSESKKGGTSFGTNKKSPPAAKAIGGCKLLFKSVYNIDPKRHTRSAMPKSDSTPSTSVEML